VIDDRGQLAESISRRCAAAQWTISTLTHADPGLLFDLKLLALLADATALRPDPWRWLQDTRTALPKLPILMWSTASTVDERVRGLNLGADDWLNASCEPAEVIARIQRAAAGAHRSRPRDPAAASAMTGDLIVEGRQARKGDHHVELSHLEAAFLWSLGRDPGTVVTKAELHEDIFGFAQPGGCRSVDELAMRARNKLKRLGDARQFVHTHVNSGYSLNHIPSQPRA
jgi:DNA-binding response OmpR family regulator